MVQYRDKAAAAGTVPEELPGLLALCRRFGVPLLVNDDAELALRIGADGVHVGQSDPRVAAIRARPGGDRLIIGASCYNQLGLAEAAAADGADYVAFGAFHPSATKPGAVRAAPWLLTEAKERLRVPIVAIGGITPDNGAALIRAGADALAVVGGLFGPSDVKATARAYSRLFHPPARGGCAPAPLGDRT